MVEVLGKINRRIVTVLTGYQGKSLQVLKRATKQMKNRRRGKEGGKKGRKGKAQKKD